MAALSLKKITKTYPNGFRAVNGIDLEINDGEFLVLVGPSGCAKSTLLRMIAGLESITGGELKIGDTLVNDLSAKQRGIAMVFQNYALYPHMTVFDNLSFGLKLAGVHKREIDTRVKGTAELLEMTALLDRYPRQLSGGQAQRVALGRAIVKRPEVFLFDEPLSNLDAKLRAAMRVRLTELHRTLRESGQASTAIYVTHDQVEAMTMGERICILKEGHIQQVDTPTNLYERPANAFVAGFIGSPEMNLHPVRPVPLEDGIEISWHRQSVKISKQRAACFDFSGRTNITFGLRPEHISATAVDLASTESCSVVGQIKFFENMGSEVFVHFDVDGLAFICRVAATAMSELQQKRRGESHTFNFQMAHCHLFDITTGVSLQIGRIS